MTRSCALNGPLLSRTLLRSKTSTWIKDIELWLFLQTTLPNTKALELNCRHMQTSFQNKTKSIITINPTCHIWRLNKVLQTGNGRSRAVVWKHGELLQYVYQDFSWGVIYALFFPLFKTGLQFTLEFEKQQPASYKRTWQETCQKRSGTISANRSSTENNLGL